MPNEMRDAMKRGLPSVDDLFTSQAERDDEKLAKIREISLSEIDEFPDHPFHVNIDEDMQQLVESVSRNGVMTPATVRRKEDGRYELISGHRRKKACELAGIELLPCEVKELSRDEAVIMMVESNLQRSTILPSEKAFAYKMRLEAMKRQGQRSDLTSAPLEPKLRGTRSNEELAAKSPDSRAQIQRYIRLTYLESELLALVDDGKIKMRPAVEISYLKPDEQTALYETIQTEEATPSHEQAIHMRELSDMGRLNEDVIFSILSERKPNQKEKFSIPRDRLSRYFSASATPKEIEDTIMRALDMYQRKRERDQAR